jgi:hypothetical protein
MGRFDGLSSTTYALVACNFDCLILRLPATLALIPDAVDSGSSTLSGVVTTMLENLVGERPVSDESRFHVTQTIVVSKLH